jgi:hypothetical protein
MRPGKELLANIRQRGHWRVLIRPRPYRKDRLDIGVLLPIVEQARVRLRGWDFPHVKRPDVVTYLDFIEQGTESDHHVELFRFYQSGQFVHYSGFSDDWRDQSTWWPPDAKWRRGMWLGIGTTIYRFTEAFEFAARLAGTEAGDGANTVTVLVEANGLQGRLFYVDNPKHFDTATSGLPAIQSFPYKVTVSRAELLARARPLGLKGLTELFKRCRVDISDRILKEWQDEVGTVAWSLQ